MVALSPELPKIDKYRTLKLIHNSDRTLVYRGQKLENEQPVVIKLMGREYPSFSELVQFRNQYAISKNLEIEGIVKPYALERYKNRYALIMEDIGGISLAEWKEKISLSPFFNIALQLTDILHQLHQNQIIHKDIKPANILIHPETQQIQLIDFSISTLLPKETQTIQTPNVLEGTLAYLSPEQTGRMNRGIDYRSDFYALGVTLYELLAGHLPFNSDDPMELIHAHITQQPIPLDNWLNDDGENHPQSLSDIILKLMAKNAEDRYQSALGLKHDLEKCRTQWQETGAIAPFVLGERDLCDRFNIPEKLYGRETEVQTLLDAFERVASPQSNAEMLLVAGFSGIGKTAVINEVHKPIVRQKGYFIKGKFDQFNRNIPFSAFVQAFRDLMGQLLGESNTQLQAWKAKILTALGENGQVLIEVIPELQRIIGEQPPVPELSGSAAQNRFNLLFEKFIAVFTTREHPLTLFLDDLQWADSASLNLMKVLMSNSQTGYLLLLGAYRDNEVFPAHPLMLSLAELEKQDATISTVTLAPLSIRHINQLVADTLSCSVELAAPLTDLVYQKTKGNPFFTTQFLKGLYEDELIVFNRNLGYWECDLVKVRDAALTDDVVEFMAGRLHKLPEKTQNLLQLAACIGNQFDLETLAIICENSSEEVAADLWNALQEGFILPQSEAYKFFQGEEGNEEEVKEIRVGYRFLHDRVQQAAYSLIDTARKQSTHLTIGERLHQNTPEAFLEERIFLIINHLNMGVELLSDRDRQKEIAQLNLIAGKKAIHSIAYGAALEYLSIGLKLLPETCWSEEHHLTLSLHEELALANYLNGNFSETESCIQAVLDRTRTKLDRVKVCEIRIQAFISQHKLTEAVNVALEFLAALGIEFPANPTLEDAGQAFKSLKANLVEADLSVEALLNLPENQDPLSLAASRIMARVYPALYFTNPILMILALFRATDSARQYGNDTIIPYAYAACGAIIYSTFNDFEFGFGFGQLAIDVLNKLDAKEMKGRVFEVFYGHIKAWKFHLRETLDPLVEGYQSALEVGDLEYAGYNATMHCYHAYFAGVELPNVEAAMAKYYTTTEQTLKHTKALYWQASFYESVLNLQGKTGNTSRLLGDICNEERLLPIFREQNDYTLLNATYLNKLILSYLFEDYSAGIEWAAMAEESLHSVAGMYAIAVFYWYDSLVRLACFPDADRVEQAILLEKVAANQEKFKQWLHHAPMNYAHKFALVEAEQHRVRGRKLEAIESYDRAIEGAKTNEYIQEEALARELAAKFYLAWGKETIAESYMQKAYYCYAQWGAKAKTDDLEKRYPQLLKPILQQQRVGWTGNGTITTLTKKTISSTETSTGELLDLASLMKASRSLSQEIDLDRAIANFMQVIQENAGAETAALMLFQDDALMLVARAMGAEISVADIPVETGSHLPLTLINQVRNTGDRLVLDNATAAKEYAGDAYIQTHQPQSVLCLPLIDRGQLVGILYLENNRTKGAFTGDRVEILNLLCSQAAIALQKAHLYNKEQQARNDLQQALTDLQQAQLQLVQNEKMATLGNLVAGVAHEINNPVGFISGNVGAAQEHLQDLLYALELYQQKSPSLDAELAEELEDLDLDFIAKDFPKLIASMQSGCDRIRNISTSLRSFSRMDADKKTEFNLHEGLDSTLLILKYRLKANEERPAIEIVKNYGEIPVIKCYPGQLNQVFMNLLANAIDALDESNLGKTYSEIEKAPNRITIHTSSSEDKKEIQIAIIDNGKGMSEAVKAKIFEQGFTTKEVGKGTGLGMAIARQIIEEKHGGAIAAHSSRDRGTEFMISLPLN